MDHLIAREVPEMVVIMYLACYVLFANIIWQKTQGKTFRHPTVFPFIFFCQCGFKLAWSLYSCLLLDALFSFMRKWACVFSQTCGKTFGLVSIRSGTIRWFIFPVGLIVFWNWRLGTVLYWATSKGYSMVSFFKLHLATLCKIRIMFCYICTNDSLRCHFLPGNTFLLNSKWQLF